VSWETIGTFAALIGVIAVVVALGTWWQLRVLRWVRGRAKYVDEEKFPEEARRRIDYLRRRLLGKR
jgi:hypothetical protein